MGGVGFCASSCVVVLHAIRSGGPDRVSPLSICKPVFSNICFPRSERKYSAILYRINAAVSCRTHGDVDTCTWYPQVPHRENFLYGNDRVCLFGTHRCCLPAHPGLVPVLF